ncbi:MutS-related protein [Mangrovihabitans endophyticus]|uniref:DNA mismatch repair protein MutS n=1 Tax=Mangrovihabitans endophyticus TaxID=1751298 RepID=A0A8J3BUM2_9ACTN|nr:DNA mismatch repair protein MutS [Mangrovihabitans endophyticus]GGK79837.1 DNA mismatch repair protein MutS [Mangrovihabitans endophyticus]
MKTFLLLADRDLDPEQPLPFGTDDLVQDLHLDTLYEAMSGGDDFLAEVVRRVVPVGLSDVEEIRYRQDVLADCAAHPQVISDLYTLTVDAIKGEKKSYFGFGFLHSSPDLVLHRSVEVLQMFAGMLRRLRAIADTHGAEFQSAGFTRFFAMIAEELDDDYLTGLDEHVKQLQFRDGVLISALLGRGGRGIDYVLRRAVNRPSWWQKLTADVPETYTYRIPDRDEAGARALGELRDRGVNLVANALAQSTEHILAFFTMLRTELAFYLGCLRLQQRLDRLHAPLCRPEPQAAERDGIAASGLYDVCLALRAPQQQVVLNDLTAADTRLIVVTGANQGGKSTLLRAIGLAQVMMQCGMPVGATSLTAGIRSGIFTHFKREEDAGMDSGKLDEEMARMAGIADHLRGHALVLFNESFAATNEREGSEINRQIIQALTERHVSVVTVTHLYDLAHQMQSASPEHAVFLRAERRPDGRRTFKVVAGEPLPTSYGADLYHDIFGADERAKQPAAP